MIYTDSFGFVKAPAASTQVPGNSFIITFGKKGQMKRAILAFIFLLTLASLSAHPWKPKHYVIVDTDGGIDDQKAICMLLASPDVRILAVTVSDGFHGTSKAYSIIRIMLDSLWHEGLQMASGDRAISLIEECLSGESSQVTFIALGSLKTAADALEGAPSFTKKVKQIWSNQGLPGEEGLNYKASPESAKKVLDGPLAVSVTGGGGEAFYNDALLKEIGEIKTPYARKVNDIIRSRASHSFVFSAYDELVPLLLHYPSLFIASCGECKNRFYFPADPDALRKAAVTILKGETVKKMQVIKAIPADTSFYMTDLQRNVTEIRNKYGEDEWASGVIANELHRHLGVFAIIGVKMGIRAREYFCTGVDEMSVTTHAGSTPPLSCMNDGIQVSTGATPGHGLLKVGQEAPFSPSADFTHKGRTIRITLNKELAEKVSSELQEINFVNGLDSDIYWEMVRQNTIKYWLQFDRHEIFDIEVIN
jgi:pyrimidine-specific ribonucleoside hydrolase